MVVAQSKERMAYLKRRAAIGRCDFTIIIWKIIREVFN